MTGSRDRILHLLKTKGPQAASELARRLEITAVGARQHLAALQEDGLVDFEEEARGVGRPARLWRLTPAAEANFPDSHGELAVGMLEAMRRAFGDDGLAQLVRERTKAQIRAYKKRLPDAEKPLSKRISALAALRREEGYMAEWSREKGGYLLVENHCPICAAARFCQGLCAGELELFRAVLGRGVSIERTEHILEGARRCSYRITSRR